MEGPDVVLAGHQHAATGVDPRGHGGLAALARFEVLLVDPVEQLHGRVEVALVRFRNGQVERSY